MRARVRPNPVLVPTDCKHRTSYVAVPARGTTRRWASQAILRSHP
jgi:hypothetical protein